MCERSPCGFEGKPSSPMWPGERPTYLSVGPTIRKVQTNSANKNSRRSLFDRPHTESPKMPVTNEHGHLPPCIFPSEDSSIPDVAHDLRVSAHRGIGTDVGVAKGPEHQAIGLKREHGCRKTRSCHELPYQRPGAEPQRTFLSPTLQRLVRPPSKVSQS